MAARRLGPCLCGPLVVELDEEPHFNRYRALTLTASWAKDLPWTRAYRSYCVEYEDRCLDAGDWGKRWTNGSAGRMFSGEQAGKLDGDGAPRWKQRAFYDALKDTGAGNEIGVAIARVANYDPIDGALLEDVLERRAVAEPAAVLAQWSSGQWPVVRARRVSNRRAPSSSPNGLTQARRSIILSINAVGAEESKDRVEDALVAERVLGVRLATQERMNSDTTDPGTVLRFCGDRARDLTVG